jgi:AbiV family abortive infection protein
VDLAAVKDASARELAQASAAAARNARGLADDAELLSGAGRLARASALAGLAVEEVGKACALVSLSAMPEKLKAQAPVGGMLEWHQMKLIAGELRAALPSGPPPTMFARLAVMPLDDVACMLDDAQAFALDADRLKQRGLYVDFDRTGQIRQPSQVTAAQVREQLDRAQQAASAVDPLLDSGAPGWLADQGEAAVEFSRALVSAFPEVGHRRSAEAAADVLLSAAAKLQG